jgi:hypothetical protein
MQAFEFQECLLLHPFGQLQLQPVKITTVTSGHHNNKSQEILNTDILLLLVAVITTMDVHNTSKIDRHHIFHPPIIQKEAIHGINILMHLPSLIAYSEMIHSSARHSETQMTNLLDDSSDRLLPPKTQEAGTLLPPILRHYHRPSPKRAGSQGCFDDVELIFK